MPAPRKDITKEILQDLYNQGLCQRQIAEQFHTTQTMICFYMKRFGIKARTQSEIMSGINHWNWKGGKRVSIGKHEGYVIIHNPTHPNADYNGYVREHILIMEKHLGRFLTKEEVVHHLNGIKTDNRLENLVLCANQAEHNLYHPKKKDPITGRFTK